jgi:hypothetical protein
MTAFRLFDPFQTFTDLHGNLAVGGNLTFYAAGTTTPQSVYADPALSADNGNVITIGVDGRPVDDIWGSGAYRARLYADDATLISDMDNIQIPGGTGTTIPALVSGQFLTNDGAVLSWEEILQLPDPSGSANKVLSTDGANFIWVSKPADGANGTAAAVVVTPTKTTIGDGSTTQDVFMVQSGSDTIAASGASFAQKTITFPTAFKACMIAVPTVTSTGDSILGPSTIGAVNTSATGFTAYASVSAHGGGTNNDQKIINPVTFNWVAFGTIAA